MAGAWQWGGGGSVAGLSAGGLLLCQWGGRGGIAVSLGSQPGG